MAGHHRCDLKETTVPGEPMVFVLDSLLAGVTTTHGGVCPPNSDWRRGKGWPETEASPGDCGGPSSEELEVPKGSTPTCIALLQFPAASQRSAEPTRR